MSALATPDISTPAAAPIRLTAIQSYLNAQSILMPSEDEAAYQALAANYLDAYRPETPGEFDLVHTLHQTRWRIERYVALEHNLIAIGAARSLKFVEENFEAADDLTRRTLAQTEGFLANARAIAQVNRQEARLERSYSRLRVELEQLIALRNPEAESETQQTPATPAPAPGFVPPKSIEPMPNFTGPMKDIKRKQWLRRQLKEKTAALGL